MLIIILRKDILTLRVSTSGLESGDRFLQFASLNFDASVAEIFSCLSSGATLVLRSEQMWSSIPTFMQKCQDYGVTVMELPTALAKTLGKSQLVYALKALGLDGEQPQDTITSMAETYIQAIRQVNPTGSYLIGGYSFGGLIAYEMVSQLEAMGEKVENLLTLGWGNLNNQQVEIHTIAGEHHQLLQEPYVNQLSMAIQEALLNK